ncbi:MAG: hypothetical protein ACJ8C4_00550 [Gemmataceae bacterium]
MAKYQTKQIVIEAVRYLGGGNMEGGGSPSWVWEALERGNLLTTNGRDPLLLRDRKGMTQIVDPGNWIIRYADGGLESCGPVLFNATYESA